MHKHQDINQINRKQLNILKYFWNIWYFIFLFNDDDSALKVTKQITFRGLVTYKPVAYKKSVLR